MTVAARSAMVHNRKPPVLEALAAYWLHNRCREAAENGASDVPHFQHLVGRNARGVSVTIHQIQQLVAARFGVSVLDLVSRRQGQATYRPRQVAFWLARHLTPCAMRETGRAFGGRDHTTVMHGIDRVEAAIAAGDAWGGEAVAIRNNLAGRMAA